MINMSVKSRIAFFAENKYCHLDGKECTRCEKCKYIPKKSRNWLSKIIIILLIIILLYLIFFQMLPMAIELNQLKEKQSNDFKTLDEEVEDYNLHMSDEERRYREYYGIGNETVGENYNPMKLIRLDCLKQRFL